jgi:oligo-1,6-glucosidase
MTIVKVPWWQDATVYQIYPASFKDANGDGLGDIPGIISELDYIASLGVNVIWVCPMYDSPQLDMGYDISDYESVYPPYGSLQDMETLINECHGKGLRIILDLVVNHTSDQHAWFQESRSSSDNLKRDWYIWRPARYDHHGNRNPPNNWRSYFGGSAWQWDDLTQEFYLHLFASEQPDLNWEKFETRQAIYNSAMHFWLRKGVDGFRVDTANMYSKAQDFPDAEISDPTSEWQFAANHFCNGPRMHEYLREMNEVLETYGAMSVGELPHTHELSRVLPYVSAREKQLSMAFQFDVVDVGVGKEKKYDTVPRSWQLSQLKTAFRRSQDVIKGTDAWTTVFMENHDQARSISRFGSDKSPELWDRSGKMLATLLGTMSGTLYIYQGQEIGMLNAPASWSMAEYKDIESINFHNEAAQRTNHDPTAMQRVRAALQHLARDHARLPMQWNSSRHGGFTTGRPWMRVNDNRLSINVDSQSGDKKSILSFWKRVLRFRKEYSDLFVHGMFELIDVKDDSIFAYKKVDKAGQQALVILNFGEEPQPLWAVPGRKLFGNYEGQAKVLRPYESAVYLV